MRAGQRPLRPVGPRGGAARARLSAHLSTDVVGFPCTQGSGPFGLMGPAELQRAFGEVQAALARAMPRLRLLAERPGAAEMRAGVLSALSRRALARTIKAVLGPQARHVLCSMAACLPFLLEY